MIIIDISIDEIDAIKRIGAVRINPKHTPKQGEFCTYEYGYLNNKNQLEPIGKLVFPYGDALKLSQAILKEINDRPLSSLSN